MKILHSIYDHPSNPWVGGGGAVRAYEILKRLALKGHEITVLSGKYHGAEDYSEGRLKFVFMGSNKNYLLSTFSFAFHAAKHIKKHSSEYDMVVEDFAPWNPVFSFVFSKRPSVLHVNHREGLNIIKRWPIVGLPFYVIETLYPKFFRHVTALSEWTRKKIGVPALILPAGIDERLLENIVPDSGDDGFVYYVGRLHIKNKGLDTLIEAMKILGRAKLVVAGRGKDEEKLKEMSKGLNVEFLGFVDEQRKMEFMKRASVFVLPSRFEGWGIVVLEAAVCGKPVVVSDIPELDYAVKGGFGFSFKKGDAKDLAEKIKRLMDNSSLRREMGNKALGYARGYTWEKIADDYENYLIGITSGNNL